MTRAGRKRRPFNSQPFWMTWRTVCGRMVGGRLHGDGLVTCGVEGLACRVDDRESCALESLEEQPVRRLLPLGQGRGIRRRRRFERESERIGNGQQFGRELLDPVLTGGIDIARGALADVLELRNRAQEVGAMLLGPALGLREQ